MNFETRMLIISSISFIIFLLLLIHYTYISEVPKLFPSNISEEYLGRKISITGKIVNIIEREKVNYIIVSDGMQNFTITIFPNVFEEIKNKVSIGKNIEVIGILSTYKNNLQIILQNSLNLKIIE